MPNPSTLRSDGDFDRTYSRSRYSFYAVGVFIVFYVGFLIVSIPASFCQRLFDLPPIVQNLSGTLWNGQAMLSQNGTTQRIGWTISPWQSLTQASLTGDWSLRGATSVLSGTVSLNTQDLTLQDVKGQLGWELVSLFAPNLSFSCTPLATLDIAAASFNANTKTPALTGTASSPPGECQRPDGNPVPVPPLVANAIGKQVVVTQANDPKVLLKTDFANQSLIIILRPAGAQLIPDLPTNGNTVLEFPF